MSSSIRPRVIAQSGIALAGAVLWGVAEAIALFRARRLPRSAAARR